MVPIWPLGDEDLFNKQMLHKAMYTMMSSMLWSYLQYVMVKITKRTPGYSESMMEMLNYNEHARIV